MGRLPVGILLITLVETVALEAGVDLLLRRTVRNSGILVVDLSQLVKSSYTFQCTRAPRHALLFFARKLSRVLLALN